MEQLEQINVGQQANDGTGDPLRDGMQTVNANFTKVEAGVGAVEQGVATATATANDAKTKADAAVPAAEKGMAGGVAPLDDSGKVPAAHLPELTDYIPMDQKGAAGGVASLDSSGKVPMANLPAGTAGGVAPLDAGGKVPAANLPAAADSIPLTEKGAAGGVATLDADGQVPSEQLEYAVKSTEKASAGGVATLDAGGKVPAGQLPPIPTGPPVGSVAWWPLRSSIPAGQIPADGQTISRATFPDIAAMVAAGTVPVVSDSDWLADPLKRGSYTTGDGTTTIRVPDYNGVSSGAVAAVTMRGDGARSAGTNGVIQKDALQNITASWNVRPSSGTTFTMTAGAGAVDTPLTATGSGVNQLGSSGTGGQQQITFDASRVARTDVETRMTNVSGVWTIQAFGAVTNPGSVDAAQLASDYAALNAAFQPVRDQVFGLSQSYQDVTGSRAFDLTVYTNTTGRPIVIHIGFNVSGSAVVDIHIRPSGATGWIPGSTMGFPSAANGLSMMCVVAAGASYRMQKGNAATISSVWEYR